MRKRTRIERTESELCEWWEASVATDGVDEAWTGRGAPAVVRGTGGTILRELALGEKSVTELVQATGMSQPNVSNHLGRLRDRGLVAGERRGRQIVYRLASAGLAHLMLLHGEHPSGPAPQPDLIAEQFLQAVLTLREEEPVRLVDGAMAAGLEWRDLYLGVFVPTLERIGDLWERGELTVANEHLITGIVLRLLHRLSLALPPAPDEQAPTAIVGCVEGELHSVGGRMVADFLLARGWRAWYLNGYLPADYLMEAVLAHSPDAVVLCISMEECTAHLEATVARLRECRAGGRLPLIVAGGRYFSGGRVHPGLDLCGTDIETVTAELDRMVREARKA
ncbi:MAG: putative cobalamin binding protein [Armatimonadetes bacterium]|jgi:methanogenic corrinoid protein MtbC1|nr:putative cobalamin binding protein [Armatimonadota bacterium]